MCLRYSSKNYFTCLSITYAGYSRYQGPHYCYLVCSTTMDGIGYLLYVTALVLVLTFPCIMEYLNDSNTMMADTSQQAQFDVPLIREADVIDHEDSSLFMLYTTFGGNYSSERLQEIVATLSSNANLAIVAGVHILSDPATVVAMKALSHNSKIKFIAHSGQPTYQDLFSALNQRTASHQLGVVMNADIQLDDQAFACLSLSSAPNSTIIALTRHPHPACPKVSGGAAGNPRLPLNLCLTRRQDGTYVNSADTFIVAPPVSQGVLRHLTHPQNRLGSENLMLYYFQQANYTIRNPCATIKTYHHHCVAERHASALRGASRVDGQGRKALLPRDQWTCPI
eukprot:m.35288 g.35288  ORF g.35288 m.35288 type:complete len:339 (-) comp12377_c0_seq1:36-1052(-)